MEFRTVQVHQPSDLYNDNYVTTTKYSLWNFVPVCLLNQYKRLANVWFLLMSILSFFPSIAPWEPIAQVFPTIFVLVVALIREAYEDFLRWRADRETNFARV